jgi:hypothetical protein
MWGMTNVEVQMTKESHTRATLRRIPTNAQIPLRRQPSIKYNVVMTRTPIYLLPLALLVVVFSGGGASAAESPDFEQQILPLLYTRCFSCHSEKTDKPKADLRLDSIDAIRESGAVVPGKPDESELLRRVSLSQDDEQHMPPLRGGSQPLSEVERDLFRRWIAAGAKTGSWTKFEHREPASNVVGPPLTRADVPQLAQRVDDLVLAYHRAKGTQPNPAVSDETFLRRVYLDIAGRVPSLAESQRFWDDTAPNKRAKLIDQLLDSEAYVSHMFNWKADQLRLVSKGIQGQPGWMYDDWVKSSIRSGMKYDEYVRQLITAKGYLWENGAVGFYVRDLGMPLDHMSNLSRVFLGTRIECAQCHDHPFEPVTQRDFYQLTAYTFGVSNLYSPAGYSTDNVKHWDELQARLKAMNAGEGLRQNVSGTTAPLKRLTKDTDHRLKYPDNYANDATLRGQPVECRTPFGDEAPATTANRREVFAQWVTSPRNPRFAKNIANRLWKRVFGQGLIEPVDSLSPVNRPENPELLEFLTHTMARLGYDERAYLAVLLNSRLYQSEPVRIEPEPGSPFTFAGPLLRRLSAEQIWDSLLTLLVEDLDERKPLRDDQGAISRERLVQLTNMSADELLQRAQVMMEFREQQRKHNIDVAARKAALQLATEKGDDTAIRQIQQASTAANIRFEQLRQASGMGGPATAKETDPRWAKTHPSFIRAAEILTPIPLGHFLRQFGQSDRREIDAFNKTPNITHSLALMNGELTRSALEEGSYLRRGLRPIKQQDERVQAIYQSILIRRPTADESQRCRDLFAASPTAEADLIWALLNSPEFLFQQ